MVLNFNMRSFSELCMYIKRLVSQAKLLLTRQNFTITQSVIYDSKEDVRTLQLRADIWMAVIGYIFSTSSFPLASLTPLPAIKSCCKYLKILERFNYWGGQTPNIMWNMKIYLLQVCFSFLKIVLTSIICCENSFCAALIILERRKKMWHIFHNSTI